MRATSSPKPTGKGRCPACSPSAVPERYCHRIRDARSYLHFALQCWHSPYPARCHRCRRKEWPQWGMPPRPVQRAGNGPGRYLDTASHLSNRPLLHRDISERLNPTSDRDFDVMQRQDAVRSTFAAVDRRDVSCAKPCGEGGAAICEQLALFPHDGIFGEDTIPDGEQRRRAEGALMPLAPKRLGPSGTREIHGDHHPGGVPVWRKRDRGSGRENGASRRRRGESK